MTAPLKNGADRRDCTVPRIQQLTIRGLAKNLLSACLTRVHRAKIRYNLAVSGSCSQVTTGPSSFTQSRTHFGYAHHTRFQHPTGVGFRVAMRSLVLVIHLLVGCALCAQVSPEGSNKT